MYLKNEQMELTDFLHTDINWRILKGDRNFFGGWGVGIVKNECGQSGGRGLQLAVFEEWIDRINWFYAYCYRFTKIES